MTKEELLEETKRRYPIGTKFYAVHLDGLSSYPEQTIICTVVEGDYERINKISNSSSLYISFGNTRKNGHVFNECIYDSVKGWARIHSLPETIKEQFIFSI